MISAAELHVYRGPCLARGEGFLYVPPHPLLSPYISCYTISCPTPATMSAAYSILPSASCTFVATARAEGVFVHLRGVNTRPVNVGAHANRARLLVLVEFRPGGLFPFLKADSRDLLDRSVPMEDIAPVLSRAAARMLERCGSAEALVSGLDALFLPLAAADERDGLVRGAVGLIRARRGGANARVLTDEFHYGEKQLRRIFLERVGVGPKAMARIARINCAARLIRASGRTHADIAAQAGYFDQSHLIRDFREICGTTPLQYARNMSDFYNDAYKL